MKILLPPAALCALLLFTAAVTLSAQAVGSSDYSAAPFFDGEYLRYKVKYGFIRLGTFELRQKRIDPDTYVVTMRATSAAGLPLITFDSEYRSVLQKATATSRDYRITEEGGKVEGFSCTYDPATRVVSMRGPGAGGGATQHLRLEGPFYDGVGFLMLLRCISAFPRTLSVPSIMDFKPAKTLVICHGGREEVECAAMPDPLPARMIETRADWKDKAAAGMGGNMRIWLSDDAAALPIRAEMKIAVGSVRMELESYARTGWNPHRVRAD